MNVESCRFVLASDVFKDCSDAWATFCDNDPDCSFGSNNRSMITVDVIRTTLENFLFEDEDDVDYQPSEEEKQIKLVFERLDSIEHDVYIDLEN